MAEPPSEPDWEGLLYSVAYLGLTGLVGIFIEWVRRKVLPARSEKKERKAVEERESEEPDAE